MRVLFDIVHPADVLFFKRPLDAVIGRGDEVLILSRHKDVACSLLDGLGFAHEPISSAGSGYLGLAAELVSRDLALFRAARRFKPDVMIGFGGVAIAHVGQLLRVPAISFYDSENARLQNRITWPLISRLYVPEAYSGPTPRGRTTRLPGTKELSYFHPRAFRPDRSVAIEDGLDPDRPNFFVRVVAWRANHDVGKTGWTLQSLRAGVSRLSRSGRVHLSSELDVPDDLRRFVYRAPVTRVHHLLAHCRMMVGESATMASEAAILGVPAIYAGRDFPGYTQTLESAGLLRNLAEADEDALLSAIDATLSRPPEAIRAARDSFVSRCPDWAEKVLEALDEFRPA